MKLPTVLFATALLLVPRCLAAMLPQDAILTFGDSLTQTFEEGSLNQRLAYHYCRRLDIINRGFGGYNTEWALPILEQTLESLTTSSPKIRLVTIWFGANDACLPPSPQFLPLPKFISNLSRMISLVRSHSPNTSILLITPPPISAAMRSAGLASRGLKLDRSEANTRAYAEAVVQLGKDEGVPVVDVWTGLVRAVGGEDMVGSVLRDGLHLNSAGYQILFDLLIETINSEYPKLDIAKMETVWPLWNEIDFENPSVRARVRDEL